MSIVAKRTPTPWIIIEEAGGGRGIAAVCGRNGGTVVAAIRGAVRIDGHDHSENMANACLIAAAPDLLAAWQKFLAHRSRVFDAQMQGTLKAIPLDAVDEILDEARAAIAKAVTP